MTNFNSADQYYPLDSNVPMNVSSTGTTVAVGAYEYVMFAIHWSGANANNSTCTLEVSDTGLPGTWENYPGATFTMNGASGSHYWQFWLQAIPYVHVAYNNIAAGAGTFNTAYRGEVPA